MRTMTRGQPDGSTPLSRREFVAASGSTLLWSGLSLAMGCSTFPQVGPGPLVGSQLYAWSQYYERAGKRMSEHLEEALSAVRDCGYDYAEGSLELNRPENNAQFAERCQAKGLRMVSFYTGGQ